MDWTYRPDVARALRVFEMTMHAAEPNSIRLHDAMRLFERDGYTLGLAYDIIGWPAGTAPVIREGSLANPTDADAIREHLDRIDRALASKDPAQAIGSAKEPVESTAKVVLRELDQAVDNSSDVPALVRQASVALGVHLGQHFFGQDGGEAVKKILGGAVAVTTGLSKLRNSGYGTGHGPGQP